MSRPLHWYDTITINIYFLGLTTLSQTMTPLAVPLLVQHFVGEENKGGYYGTIRLWTLMVALLVQAIMGMLSDQSTLRWGRRRPFIFIGTIGNIFVIITIGLSAKLEGTIGYTVLFLALIFMMFFANTAQGAAQGLIPDLVPEENRGRYSGFKALFEIPLALILVAFTIGKFIAAGKLWAAFITAIVVLSITMIITMFVPEKQLETISSKFNWQPIIRLIIMTIVFFLVILALGKLSQWITTMFSQQFLSVQLLSMGILGLVSILASIFLGVWFSVKIGLGKSAKSNSSFTWWIINRLAFLVASTNIASFAIFYLQGRLGYEKEQAAAPASQLMMVIGLFILLLAIPSGWLSDRIGPKKLVMFSGIVGAIGTLTILLANSLPLIYIGAIIIGVAVGVFYSSNWALGTDIVPQKEAGRFLGISNLAGAGAGAIGAYIGGPIADFFTKNNPEVPGLGYILLFSIYGILFLLSILAAIKIKTNTGLSNSM